MQIFSHKRDLLFSFSVANLSFVPMWIEFFYRTKESTYYRVYEFTKTDYIAAYVVTLLFSAFVYLLIRVTTKYSSKLIRFFSNFCLLLICVLLVNVYRYEMQLPVNPIYYIALFKDCGALCFIATILIIILLISSLIYWKILLSCIRTFILILAPFGILLFGRAAWSLYSIDQSTIEHVNTAIEKISSRNNNQPRVVWIIFDELDESYLFLNRPSEIKLPEFDRLRDESIHATHAYPPSRFTETAIPSLITGELVSNIEVLPEKDLLLTIGDSGNKIRWSGEKNLFYRAQEEGFNTGIVGWYHPYCEMFRPFVASCKQTLFYGVKFRRSKDDSLVDTVLNILPLNIFVAPRRVTIERKLGFDSYNELMHESKKIINNDKLDLVYLHFSIPHLEAYR